MAAVLCFLRRWKNIRCSRDMSHNKGVLPYIVSVTFATSLQSCNKNLYSNLSTVLRNLVTIPVPVTSVYCERLGSGAIPDIWHQGWDKLGWVYSCFYTLTIIDIVDHVQPYLWQQFGSSKCYNHSLKYVIQKQHKTADPPPNSCEISPI